MISWVVPTVDGREASLERSLAPLRNRDDIEIVEVRNRPTCGKGWVDGIECVTGDYICLSADDLVPHDGFCEAMIEAVELELHPAAIVLLPNGAKQSCGGQGSDVCRGNCDDWQQVEWSPTPFIAADWWRYIEPHADKLASLHYSSDRLVSACLWKYGGIESVVRRPAILTHHNEMAGRLSTAGADGWEFDNYRAERL